MKNLVLLAMLLAGPAAFSTEMVADTIVCESEQDLDFMRDQNLVGQLGTAVIKNATATRNAYALLAEHERTTAGFRAEEERIRAAGNLRGSVQAQHQAAIANAEDDTAKQEKASSFLRRCAALSEAQSVTVIERKPISGVVKINARVNGVQADLWTFGTYLKETSQDAQP